MMFPSGGSLILYSSTQVAFRCKHLETCAHYLCSSVLTGRDSSEFWTFWLPCFIDCVASLLGLALHYSALGATQNAGNAAPSGIRTGVAKSPYDSAYSRNNFGIVFNLDALFRFRYYSMA
ncbi:hypothetical protein FA95DRAFT_128040 [Auriscalpium vulgare]|uniref:Uncharacterized protein n=1 Tax=Auriscalpium vulgare TaxID=40419 RepID=A0ACB8RNY1_9AGAM|nr:hypothetical protein FA95DRAFT_128040 [Auriscalpium vulgare]